MTRWTGKKVVTVGLIVLGTSAGLGIITATISSGSSDPGRPEWFDDNGQLVPELVPDMIPVLDRSGETQVGFVRAQDLYPQLQQGSVVPAGYETNENAPMPVFDDASRLVGHVYAGVGYVSLDEQAAGFSPEEHITPVTTAVAP